MIQNFEIKAYFTFIAIQNPSVLKTRYQRPALMLMWILDKRLTKLLTKVSFREIEVYHEEFSTEIFKI